MDDTTNETTPGRAEGQVVAVGRLDDVAAMVAVASSMGRPIIGATPDGGLVIGPDAGGGEDKEDQR